MPRRAPSIADFLTDGALAGLCDDLSQIAGAEVSLHDREGRRVRSTPEAPGWRVGEADDEAREVAAALAALPTAAARDGEAPSSGAGGPASAGGAAAAALTIVPLTALGHRIGCIAVRPDRTRKGTSLARLRVIVRRLASTVSELCDHDLREQQRHAELNILFRLSSLMAEARDADAVLNVALRSAVELLEADAGSVHLLDESEENLRLRASAGLPAEFTERIDSFPLGRAADRFELRSGVHALADLPELQRQELAPDLAAMGFADLMGCGLIFKGRSLGMLRLYFRVPPEVDPTERTLLQTIVEQAAAATASARLIETERRHREVQRQLALGADVQQRMLPAAVPSVPGLDIAARYMSCFDLGGDFYDFLNLGGHLGVLVGDVSGKGVPAALLMASIRATFRVLAKNVYHLNQLMARINETMARDTMPNEFATVFYGVIDPSPRADGSRRLTYCNAGHDPPILVRAPRKGSKSPGFELVELTTGGMVIGIDASQAYERGVVDLHPGDALIIYTDGIVDAMNFQNRKFGRARLREAILAQLSSDAGSSARSITDHITWEVRRYIGLRDATDDSTLVAIRVR